MRIRSAGINSFQKKGFTLIELLVVIAIIAILAVVVVLTLNPAQLLAQSRDANRVSDLSALNAGISLYQTDQSGASGYSLGNASSVYMSYPDTSSSTCGDLGLSSASPDSWRCSSSANYRLANGTGWVPLNFSAINSGAPFGSLPVDPANQTSTGLYYTYTTNGTQYELTADMESQKYRNGGSGDVESGDGGQYAGMYEKGTNLALEPVYYGPNVNPVVRGTGIKSTNGSTFTISWPAGTQAGDLAIIFYGGGWNVSGPPAGWTQNQTTGNSSSFGGVVLSKVLTGADISAGSVSVNEYGSYDGTAAIVTFVGATAGIREVDYGWNSTGAATVNVNTSAGVLGSDTAVYFGSNRAASTDTMNRGTLKGQANDGSNASGDLYIENMTSAGGITTTGSYSVPGNGYYQATVVVKGM